MATTSRYTLQGTGANFMDFYIPYGDISLDGQEIVFKGNSGVDAVYVGNSAGLVFDFTQAGLAVDKIYLAGDWADYSRSYSGSVVTLTQTNGGSEVIKTISGDSLVFANGTVSVLDALNFLKGTAAEPVPAGAASIGFPETVTGPLSNSVRAVVQDAAGETIALARPGVTMIVKGGSGVDVVYATPGTNVDGTLLGLGQDKLYLAGSWAEYGRSYAGSVVTLTRTVGSDTETVQFLGGSLTAYDSVVFTDGMAKSVDILNYLKGTAAAPVLDNADATPLPGPAVAITTDDNALNIGDTATLTFTLSEAATDFAAGDITVTGGGTLSNFTPVSGTVYTATLTPTDNSTTAAAVSVASGTFTNAEGQGNSAAALTVSVDTLPPTLAITSNVSAVKVGETATVTFTFSEAPTGFAAGDVTTTGGTLSEPIVTADPKVYTATFTPTAGFEGNASITVAGGVYTDAAGNTGGAGLTPAIGIDTLIPTITAQEAFAGTKTVVLTTSETVTGTPATGDFAVVMNSAANAVTNVAVSGTSVTLTLTNTIQTGATVTVDYTQGANQVTDAGGNAVASVGDPVSVTVTSDAIAPTVTAVSSTTANGTYNIGDAIDVTVQFSEAVTVTDTPQLTLETGAIDRNAAYLSGSGTDTLTFRYTVQAGDSSADLGYTTANALSLNTGTIKDLAGNNATLTLASPGTAGSLSDAKALVIEGIAPTITAQAATAGTKTVTLTMSETVTGTPAAGDFAVVTNSAANVVTNVAVSGTTVTLTLTNAIPNNATMTVDYTQGANQVTDAVGNALVSVGDPVSVTVTNDNTAPTVAGVSSTAADATYNIGDTIPVTIQFSEAVAVTGTPQLTLETGSVDRTANYVSGSGTNTLTFNYTVQSGDSSADLGYASTSALALNGGTVKDLAGNNATLTLASPGTAGSLSDAKALVIEGIAPTITAQAATAGTKTVTLTMSETVTGTPAAGDFAVVTNSAANVVTNVAVSGTTVTLTLTNAIPNNATVTVDYTQGANQVTDAVGNVLVSVGDPVSVTVTNDNTAPTVAGASSTAADATYKLGDTIPVTIQFSEAVTVTGTPQLTLETGSVDRTASYASGSGTNTLTFNYTVQAGDSSADLGYASTSALALNGGTITDLAGNNATLTLASPGTAGSLAYGKALVIDGIVPTATLTSAAYDGGTGVLTVTGANLDTLGVANGTDVKANLNWTNFVWDINGDNATTTDKTFAQSDITSAVVTNATTLTITLTAGAKAALEATAGFAATGGADKLDVTAGFIRDTAGNAASTDALANGVITHTGVVVPSVSYSTTTFNEAGANDGSITMTSTITLANDTFTGANGAALSGVTFGFVPIGLTAVVTKTSDTTATLSFTGNATAHADANDVTNLTVTLGNAAFTSGNASAVTDATKSDLAVNFADVGAIINGDGTANVLNGSAADNIIYGGGGDDTISGGAGNDTIDITDAGTTVLSSADILFTSAANGTDTIIGFSAAALSSGGDVLDFSAIAGLTDSVATGQTLATDFAANNVFVFGNTPVTIADAAGAIAADATVVATAGYIVIADSANNNAVTVYHSTDLAANGTETALAILSGVTISDLTATNFIV